MFKKVLLISAITISNSTYAGLLANFDLNYQFGDLDLSGVSLDTPAWDREDLYQNALENVLPQKVSFNFDLSGETYGSHPRGLNLNFIGNSLNAIFEKRGTQCLQGTGLLINEYSREDRYEFVGKNSGCYQTIDLFEINLDGLYSLDTGKNIQFNSLIGTNSKWNEMGLRSAQVSFERRYYASDLVVPRDYDEVLGVSGGQLKVNHTVSTSQLRVVYVPEPTTMGMFGLGVFGLAALRRKSK